MPDDRLQRTREAYEEREECLVHVPPCVRVDGEWRRQIKTAVAQPDGTWQTVWRPVQPDDKAYDWKDIPSVVTAEDVEAFDPERAMSDKRVQSDKAREKFVTEFMK